MQTWKIDTHMSCLNIIVMSSIINPFFSNYVWNGEWLLHVYKMHGRFTWNFSVWHYIPHNWFRFVQTKYSQLCHEFTPMKMRWMKPFESLNSRCLSWKTILMNNVVKSLITFDVEWLASRLGQREVITSKFQWYIISHPCPKFKGESLLKYRHGWVITSHIKQWM